MSQRTEQANAQHSYEVKATDLPISCPTKDMEIWNSHPRVFLPLDDEHPEQHCPYCGVKFILVD